MTNNFKGFMKPTSNFKNKQFQGEGIIVPGGREHKEVLFQQDGEIFKIREDNWTNAFETGQWIKLGTRCTLWSEQKIVEEREQKSTISKALDFSDTRPIKLSEIKVDPRMYNPIKTGKFLDEYWSNAGGIMPGTYTMVTGDPGIGKSSVLMDVLQNVTQIDPEKRVLYISAEMTRLDMMDPRGFIKYYPGILNAVDFIFAADYIGREINFSQALEYILQRGYDVVVWDSIASIQGIIYLEIDAIGSRKAAENYLVDLMKKHAGGENDSVRYTAHLLIQQVNKDGEFAGSKSLVHEITAFMKLKFVDDTKKKKYMVFDKNRRGSVGDRLYFKFTPTGIAFDEEKFKDEQTISEILNSEADLVKELNDLELSELLSGNGKA